MPNLQTESTLQETDGVGKKVLTKWCENVCQAGVFAMVNADRGIYVEEARQMWSSRIIRWRLRRATTVPSVKHASVVQVRLACTGVLLFAQQMQR